MPGKQISPRRAKGIEIKKDEKKGMEKMTEDIKGLREDMCNIILCVFIGIKIDFEGTVCL